MKPVEKLFNKVNGIPKPREKKAKGKNNNVIIDGVTIDGNDANWEDFISINNGPSDDYATEDAKEPTGEANAEEEYA